MLGSLAGGSSYLLPGDAQPSVSWRCEFGLHIPGQQALRSKKQMSDEDAAWLLLAKADSKASDSV